MKETETMRHRNACESHEGNCGIMAAEDIIARGLWDDWMDLRGWCRRNPKIMEYTARAARSHAHLPHAQRHRFWLAWTEKETSQ